MIDNAQWSVVSAGVSRKASKLLYPQEFRANQGTGLIVDVIHIRRQCNKVVNFAMRLANFAACAEKPSATLYPLPFYCGTCKDESLFYLGNVHAFIEYPFCREDAQGPFLKGLEYACRLIPVRRLLICDLMEEYPMGSQQDINSFKLLGCLVRSINQRVAGASEGLHVAEPLLRLQFYF